MLLKVPGEPRTGGPQSPAMIGGETPWSISSLQIRAILQSKLLNEKDPGHKSVSSALCTKLTYPTCSN